MMEEDPPEGGAPVRERLANLAMFLGSTADRVAQRYRDLLTGQAEPVSEVSKDLAELKKWAMLAYEEQSKIEKLIQDQSGGGLGHAIDFAEARDQIGRRLARLRAAGGSGEVSG